MAVGLIEWQESRVLIWIFCFPGYLCSNICIWYVLGRGSMGLIFHLDPKMCTTSNTFSLTWIRKELTFRFHLWPSRVAGAVWSNEIMKKKGLAKLWPSQFSRLLDGGILGARPALQSLWIFSHATLPFLFYVFQFVYSKVKRRITPQVPVAQ